MGVIETMTMQEACTQLGLTRRTLYTYLRDGRLRGVVVGRRWRITTESVSALLDQSRLAKEARQAKRAVKVPESPAAD